MNQKAITAVTVANATSASATVSANGGSNTWSITPTAITGYTPVALVGWNGITGNVMVQNAYYNIGDKAYIKCRNESSNAQTFSITACFLYKRSA